MRSYLSSRFKANLVTQFTARQVTCQRLGCLVRIQERTPLHAFGLTWCDKLLAWVDDFTFLKSQNYFQRQGVARTESSLPAFMKRLSHAQKQCQSSRAIGKHCWDTSFSATAASGLLFPSIADAIAKIRLMKAGLMAGFRSRQRALRGALARRYQLAPWMSSATIAWDMECEAMVFRLIRLAENQFVVWLVWFTFQERGSGRCDTNNDNPGG